MISVHFSFQKKRKREKKKERKGKLESGAEQCQAKPPEVVEVIEAAVAPESRTAAPRAEVPRTTAKKLTC